MSSLCNKCHRRCKQPSSVLVTMCPDFKKMIHVSEDEQNILVRKTLLKGIKVVRIPAQNRDE